MEIHGNLRLGGENVFAFLSPLVSRLNLSNKITHHFAVLNLQ